MARAGKGASRLVHFPGTLGLLLLLLLLLLRRFAQLLLLLLLLLLLSIVQLFLQ